jgi:hypothetical protein
VATEGGLSPGIRRACHRKGVRYSVNPERFLMYLFLLSVGSYGLFGLVAPHRLLQPKSGSWVFDWITGRAFYSSIQRVRLTCGVMFAMAVALMSLAVLQTVAAAY